MSSIDQAPDLRMDHEGPVARVGRPASSREPDRGSKHAVQAKHGVQSTEADFHAMLVTVLPGLRLQALAMTRHRSDADDLVQSAVVNALAARAQFTPGTNFGAWMYRIMRNRFLSDRRRARPHTNIDDAPSTALSRPATQESGLVMSELQSGLARLPVDHRVALIMVAVEGKSYEEVAAVFGCPVGTAKCRVFRARRQLETWLLGDGEGARSASRSVPARKRAPASRTMPASRNMVEHSSAPAGEPVS